MHDFRERFHLLQFLHVKVKVCVDALLATVVVCMIVVLEVI